MELSPLGKFLQACTKDQREAFAAACGTSQVYLYQLASLIEPNPSLRLALKIRDESARLSRRIHHPSLTLDDLLVGRIYTDAELEEVRAKEAANKEARKRRARRQDVEQAAPEAKEPTFADLVGT